MPARCSGPPTSCTSAPPRRLAFGYDARRWRLIERGRLSIRFKFSLADEGAAGADVPPRRPPSFLPLRRALAGEHRQAGGTGFPVSGGRLMTLAGRSEREGTSPKPAPSSGSRVE